MKNRPNGKKLDAGTAWVIAVIFVLEIFVKGLGEDLLLEASVLVSVMLLIGVFQERLGIPGREDLDRTGVKFQRRSRPTHGPESLEGLSK